MSTQKTYQALANAFRNEGVETCFALLGDANMHWAGAMSELGTAFVYTRHEHAAVAGAVAFARAKGTVGCASVTCGPGLTQIMTILPIAVRAHIPLVVFAGEAPLLKPWYNQAIDHAPFVVACGAEHRALHDPATMVRDIHNAFEFARSNRTAVVISVPFDLQKQDWTSDSAVVPSTDFTQTVAPTHPDPTEIEKAAAWLNAAQRPVILAGLGAVDAGAKDACVALAARSGALLATTLPAKGFFHDQAFCLGVAGGFSGEPAREIFARADLVVGIGARLASHTFDGGKLTPGAQVIQIDIDPQETVQGRKAADLLVASDARLGAEALTKAITAKTGWRTDEMKRKTAAALSLPGDVETPDGALHPMAVVKTLAGLIPPDCHVINTSGHCAFYTAQMNHHPQDHYTVIREFGAIGNGTSFALGVAAAFPERPVILLDGDGSALMHIQELETMTRHGMKVLTVVLNDGAYGSEVHKLRADGVSDAGSVFGRPDFAGIACGFGMHASTITDLSKIAALMSDFLQDPAPTVWDIHISDQIASPQIIRAHKAH